MQDFIPMEDIDIAVQAQTQTWIRQLQGQLKVSEIKDKKSLQEVKRLQAILLERDQEIEKL
jgi:hypothetical protein